MRRRHILGVVAGAAGLVLAAVPLVAFAGDEAGAELRAVTAGGRFLANIDDDATACRDEARTVSAAAIPREEANDQRFSDEKDKLSELPDQVEAEKQYLALRRSHRLENNLADRQMAACNDAADTVVNGAADEQDLFRLRVTAWPDAPASATATLATTGRVRLFVKHARWEVAGALTAADLRGGVELGLEGTDVVRDRKVWDGAASVTLTIQGKTQQVRLQEAPLLTQSNTQRLQRVFAATAEDDNGKAWRDQVGRVTPLTRLATPGDDWTQDMFEPLYEVVPGLDGRPHGMRVLLPSVSDLHRVAARITYTQLRGPDVGVVHVPGRPVSAVDDDNTYDSMGNVETEPPGPGHTHGRIVVGGTPSAEIVTFLRSQGAQDVVPVDTGWLSIGHVDEFVQFLPVAGGWKALVADPRAGLDLLRKVPAGEKLHGNLPELQWPYDERIDQRTVAEFRADAQFVDTNKIAARRIDANVAKLGLTPDRIVRVPVLFTARGLDWAIDKSAIDQMDAGPEKDKAVAALNARRDAVAETPNLINGLVAGDRRYVAPKPFGPLLGGKDVFASAFSSALTKIGYQVTYVDDLTSAHVSEGEIHCSTNAYRDYLNP